MMNSAITKTIALTVLLMVTITFSNICVQDSSHLQQQVQAELRWNQDHGFPFAQVQLVAADSCISQMALVVLPGEGYVWSLVRRLGVGITREELLVRMSLLEPGAPVVLGNVERARKLLARSGWFSSVGSARLFRERDRNRLIAAFPLEEYANNQVELMGAYQSDAKAQEQAPWTGRVLIDLQNISGTGRALYVLGETGSAERSAEFRYREPYPLGSVYVLNVNGGMWQQDSTQSQYWGELAVSQQINFEWNITVAGGESQVRQDSLQSATRWGRIAAARDGRDRIPLSRKGWMASGDLKGGRRSVSDTGSTNDSASGFAQTGVQLGVWKPLWEKLTWSNEWESSALWPKAEKYLEPELLSLGGTRLRGYWPGSIRTTAFALWTSSLQWIEESSLAEVFVEGAVVHRSRYASYGVGWEQEKTGVGVTVRIAWSKDAAPLEALLSLGVKTRF